jgi:hypothetical protein
MKNRHLIKEDILHIKNRLNAISLKCEGVSDISSFFDYEISPKLKKVCNSDSSCLDYYATSKSLIEIFGQLVVLRPEKSYVLDVMKNVEKKLDDIIENNVERNYFMNYPLFINYILSRRILDSLNTLMNSDKFKENFLNIEKIKKMITLQNFERFKTFMWWNLLLLFDIYDKDPAVSFKKSVENFLNCLESFGPSIQNNKSDYFKMLRNEEEYHIPPDKKELYKTHDGNDDMF